MKKLECDIAKFLKDRGWDDLRPSDLAKSIMIEGAELLEHFQWENKTAAELKKDKKKLAEIAKELADVFIYCLQLSVHLGFDSEKIIRNKLAVASRKYPARKMRRMKDESRPEYWQIKNEYRKEKTKKLPA